MTLGEERGRYKLEGHTPVPVDDLLEWALWLEQADRRVALTRVGPYQVSTVFMGFDHNYARIYSPSAGEPPLLFETMVLLPEMLEESPILKRPLPHFLDIQERCSTWEQAEQQHRAVVDQIRQAWDEVEEAKREHAR